MPNDWVKHIKKFARDNNITYGCALSDPRCKASYWKSSGTMSKKTKDNYFKELDRKMAEMYKDDE